MSSANLQDRASRLAEYIRSISDDAPVESVLSDFSFGTVGLEKMTKRSVLQATEAVRKSMEGTTVSEDDLIVAEAIVHKTMRPSHLIEGGWFDPFSGPFSYLSEDTKISNGIRKAIAAVGRIDLPKSQVLYGGTGFVIGKNLVMTNRHVAELFTTGVGRTHVSIKPWQPGEVDFKKEFGLQSSGFPLTECVMVHPYWDMALFRADLPDEICPLEMSVESTRELLRNDVVVLGYPAFDPDRNDPQVQQDIFAGKYNVKRIAPGRVVDRKQNIRSSWLSTSVDAMAHDSSTLGGNSGSAVLDVKSGRVAGLHFAGRYLVENYAVAGFELARDPRIIDAGVQFQTPLPAPNQELDQFWSREGEAPASRRSPTTRVFPKPTMPNATVATTIQGGALEQGQTVMLEIPLRISLTIGDAVGDRSNDGSPASTIGKPITSDGREPSPRTGGYDPEFLSQHVPTPELGTAIADDAFRHAGTTLLHYTHFSVCQSKSRMLPRFVAWNIDGGSIKSLSRTGQTFRRDTRVPDEFQAGDELYRNNPYDRGHVARRADLNWGPLEEAKQANQDSFFFTNITPQHESFNQSSKHGLWGQLENAILEDVDVEDLKVSVMAGPIFRHNDPKHRGVSIPRDFWKVIAYRDTADGQFKVAAFILSQSQLIPTEALQLDPFRLYQVTLTKLTSETELGFDSLCEFDTLESTRESLEGSGVREISGRDDVL